MEKVSYEELLKNAKAISAEYRKELDIAKKELKEAANSLNMVWVVLDDDPTGVQTVHDIAVYTDWEKTTLLKALKSEKSMFYILTNSRGITKDASLKLHRELMDNLIDASLESGIAFGVISRSDSTLRGHFPLETDVIEERIRDRLGQKSDGLILAPFFYAGGRITYNDVHYVKYGDELIPAGSTEFARDETFGYISSDLRDYIEEKTGGKRKSGEVISISLELLRQGNLDEIEKKLDEATNGAPIIVNALEPVDLEVFCAALYRSLRKGKKFVYRTAADFVKAVGAISDKPLLTKKSLNITSDKGGVIIIGSHTEKTTRQLERLRGLDNLVFMEYDSDKVLEGKLSEETKRVSKWVTSEIEKGVTAVVYTKRKVLSLPGDTKETALLRSAEISDAFTNIVASLGCEPAYIIGKGGITSSDIGTKALEVKRALVMGQIQPGVPVWKTDEDSRFPGIPYVIFPGNVGDDETLYNAVMALTDSERTD
ncbi:MAG: hydroxyacid dehydrogenase [Butyrivibrio sp.]|uniref:four-carbon acid sugar kinase family protein n=1 Tax=Butyrivibrio sp. TaxID=28121 RepID=UPI001AFFEA63|nr:four-carbon acid sugar kinase family protein [Butyrivibrio sp.]MBO6240994.1 hydroxyacid dehydrogenase [Butyrivibrio sp.]